jgi:serine/threonine-protein kinase HipA
MRNTKVFYKDFFAGILSENEEEYVFLYDLDYLNADNSKPVSLTLPLQQQPFRSKILFPFFDGLIPEGWLLSIAVKNWKIDQRDRFGLLIALCKDCIGCVSVLPEVASV